MGISDLLKMLAGGGDGSALMDQINPSSGGTAGPAALDTSNPALGTGGGAPTLDTGNPAAPAGLTPDQGAPSQGGVSAMLTPPATAPATPPGAPSAVQPSTPPATDPGLGGFLSRMVDRATTRDPSTGMSFLDKLNGFGASMTDASGSTSGAEQSVRDQGAQRVAAAQALQKRQKMQALADSLGMTPREKLIFTADPEAWVKANATGLETANVGGGDSRMNGATGAVSTAPKVGMEKGAGYTQTPGQTTPTGVLPVSPQQQLDADQKAAQDKAMEAYHQAMITIAQQRANADTTRANKPPLGNGGNWLPPGARVVHMPGS